MACVIRCGRAADEYRGSTEVEPGNATLKDKHVVVDRDTHRQRHSATATATATGIHGMGKTSEDRVTTEPR